MKEINLLPKDRQQQLHAEILYRHWLSLIWVSVFSFVLVLLAQFGSKIYLQSRLSQINEEITVIKQQVNKNDNAELKKQIKVLNDWITDYNTLDSNSPKWSKLLKTFSAIPPEGVKITSFSVDLPSKKVTITGISPTRELVIQLYNNILADSEHFYNVDYSLENVVKAKNVSFHYSFNFKDQVIH
jgi:Tfp pilus assembly protein PilN